MPKQRKFHSNHPSKEKAAQELCCVIKILLLFLAKCSYKLQEKDYFFRKCFDFGQNAIFFSNPLKNLYSPLTKASLYKLTTTISVTKSIRRSLPTLHPNSNTCCSNPKCEGRLFLTLYHLFLRNKLRNCYEIAQN